MMVDARRKRNTGHERDFRVPYLLLALPVLVAFSLIGCAGIGPRGIADGPTSTGSYPAQNLGIVLGQKLRVLSVDQGGSADKAGIQRGDVLVSMNDVKLQSAKQALEIYSKGTAGSPTTPPPIKFVLQRNGQTLTIFAKPGPPAVYPGKPTVTPAPPQQIYF